MDSKQLAVIHDLLEYYASLPHSKFHCFSAPITFPLAVFSTGYGSCSLLLYSYVKQVIKSTAQIVMVPSRKPWGLILTHTHRCLNSSGIIMLIPTFLHTFCYGNLVSRNQSVDFCTQSAVEEIVINHATSSLYLRICNNTCSSYPDRALSPECMVVSRFCYQSAVRACFNTVMDRSYTMQGLCGSSLDGQLTSNLWRSSHPFNTSLLITAN